MQSGKSRIPQRGVPRWAQYSPGGWHDPVIYSCVGAPHRESRSSGPTPLSLGEAVRKFDISHSGQTVSEAMEQLIGEIKVAQRGGERVLLVVHGFGASGVGGAIKEAMVTELPGLARRYGFKAYAHSDKDRLSRQQSINARISQPRVDTADIPGGRPRSRGEAGLPSQLPQLTIEGQNESPAITFRAAMQTSANYRSRCRP